ncbi:calumenin-B-like isoform X2 [Antedon mediterranea]|uniref:calumenin-B-like isoform X2 n=1 Tax=Antedon mediterranea TaxID=105859 RepID=UPI003AF4CDA0
MKTIVHLSLACFLIGIVAAKPAENQPNGNNRGHKLSHADHFHGDGHNADYDHDAFLGEEEARTFQDLSPEESKARLGEIVDKIDTNNDEKVDVNELKLWVENQQNKYISIQVNERWQLHNIDSDKYVTLDEYIKSTYATTEEELLKLDEAEQIDFKQMIRRDKRRWKAADKDGDGNLNKEELTAFLHPEEFDHMREVVIDETMEDVDKNQDGSVSLEEYIGDMFVAQNGEKEPDWVKTEREQFSTHRDKNKDGKMDREEIGDWIMPRDYDHAEAEAKHLIHESDKDKDEKLTKQEILDQYDLFVGSQVTDFGEALIKHDEF